MRVLLLLKKRKNQKQKKNNSLYITDGRDRWKPVLIKKCCKMTEYYVVGDCAEIVQKTVDILVLIVWKYWYRLLSIQYQLRMVAVKDSCMMGRV